MVPRNQGKELKTQLSVSAENWAQLKSFSGITLPFQKTSRWGIHAHILRNYIYSGSRGLHGQ